jgi:hypothetical protein
VGLKAFIVVQVKLSARVGVLIASKVVSERTSSSSSKSKKEVRFIKYFFLFRVWGVTFAACVRSKSWVGWDRNVHDLGTYFGFVLSHHLHRQMLTPFSHHSTADKS